MDLLLLGAESRKTHLRPKKNLAKDKYDMEDIDEFFEDDNETLVEKEDQGEGDIPKDNFNNVARKINFTDAEAESFNLSPISISSKFTSKNKKSPLRSPLLEHNKREKSQGNNLNVSNDNTSSFENIEEGSYNGVFGNDFDDYNNIEDSIIPDDETAARELIDDDYKTQQSDSLRDRQGSSLTKKMASVSVKNSSRGRWRRRPAIIDDEDESLDEGNESPFQDETTDLVSPPPSTKKSDGSYNNTPKEIIYKPNALPSPPPDGLRRSKRTRVAPLAYWRNERIVYSRVNESNGEDPDTTLASDIRKVPLQEIKEVVHIPEIHEITNQPKRRIKNRARGSPPKRTKKEIYDYESDPEIEGSEWFKSKSLNLEVFENLDEEIKGERTVAWTPDGAVFEKPPPNDDDSSPAENFEVATLFNHNKDFSASGLLNFPFEGSKSLRNSGDCVFTFHVVKGLIEVSLNNEIFIVTRGCSFEIPNNNIYGFKNIGQGNARLFFVQSRVPSTNRGDDDTW